LTPVFKSRIQPRRLVIFDCDGVLVDSEVISSRVLAEALTAVGLPTTLTEAQADYQGLLIDDMVLRAEGKLGRSLPNGWQERFEHDRGQAFRAELRPVPGAAEAVTSIIAARISVCVASQGELQKTRPAPPLPRAGAVLCSHGGPREAVPGLVPSRRSTDGGRAIWVCRRRGLPIGDRGCKVSGHADTRILL